MTGRTHDLAAFTAVNMVIAYHSVPEISLATAILAFGANMIGGLTPDIDQPTAKLWRDLPAGTILGKIFSPLLGGHRFISHSIAGLILFGGISRYLTDKASHIVLVNMDIVWFSFMIGYISHLIMDTFTKEGVPWFFPIPFKFGLPPFKFSRVTTGSWVEKYLVFPALLLSNAYIFYENYDIFLNFLKHFF